ncbi:hypothetical protein PLICRDRAFT_27705 [Plicaturopsis crispa FD-325 SS-3]|nr:hypothetical protein PLICRDRAFT_27705 [Plicaturopsis crispa FD-325 SS-3]
MGVLCVEQENGEIPTTTVPTGVEPAAGTDADVGTSASALEASSISPHVAFGRSIANWPAFPDTIAALRSLARHFRLNVLSNVDRDSWNSTHALLSQPPPGSADTSVQSPFSVVLTAEDTGAYKPSLIGFHAMLNTITSSYPYTKPPVDPTYRASSAPFTANAAGADIFADIDFPTQVLVVAQSLFHDHGPAQQLGLASVWIDRQGGVMGFAGEAEVGGDVDGKKYNWRFESLGEFAAAVEKELAEDK